MSDKTDKRLLVIGLDGGTFDLLLPYAKQGLMPNLSRLLDESAWGNLASTVPAFTAPAWSSYATGVNPGRHGILQFNRFNRYEYEHKPIGFADADMLPKTIWEFLSDAEIEVGVVNVPLTYPVRPVNGYMLSGMMTPPNAQRTIYPPEYKGQIGDAYRFDVKFVWDNQTFRDGDFPEKRVMLEEIHQVMRDRFVMLRQLMQTQPTRFLMLVVTATDRLGHFFWEELVDIAEGRSSTPIHTGIQEILTDLDHFIGEMMALYARSQDYLMLMSDHGFGPSPTQRFNLHVVLRDLGLLVERSRSGLTDLEYWRVRLGRIPALKRLARAILPQQAQTQVTNLARQVSGESLIDWEKTKAYYEPVYFQMGGIVINTVGEKRHGNVMPGKAYHSCRKTIIEALLKIKHPTENRPLFKWIAPREEIYRGPHVVQFPDILFELDGDFVASPALAGSELIEPEPPFRSGEHRAAGIFALRGPDVMAQEHLEGLSLIDLPGTILYLLDLPVPVYFEGTVLTQLWSESQRAKKPVLRSDVQFEPVEHKLSEHEEMNDEVEARLKGLGYIE